MNTTRDKDSLYMVFHDFAGYEAGSQLSAWPLHLTIVPYFHLNQVSEASALAIIDMICRGIDIITIQPGRRELFGPSKDLPVTTVNDPSGRLLQLHTALIQDLQQAGCTLVDSTYTLNRYAPHITHRGQMPVPTDGYMCMSFSVARRNGPHKSIVSRIGLLD